MKGLWQPAGSGPGSEVSEVGIWHCCDWAHPAPPHQHLGTEAVSLHRDWSPSNPFPWQQSSVTKAQSLGTSRGLVPPPLPHTQRLGLSQGSLPHPGMSWCHRLCHTPAHCSHLLVASGHHHRPHLEHLPHCWPQLDPPLPALGAARSPGGCVAQVRAAQNPQGVHGIQIRATPGSLLLQPGAEGKPCSPGLMLSPGTEQEHSPGQLRASAR